MHYNYSHQGNRRRCYKCITNILIKVIEEDVINALQIAQLKPTKMKYEHQKSSVKIVRKVVVVNTVENKLHCYL